LSPQTRRGRAVPPSHRKPTSPAAAAPDKPAAAAVAAKSAAPSADPVKVAAGHSGGHRGGFLGRIRRSAFVRYMDELVGAYIPVLIVFVVVFAGLWGWISFGPHPPTAKDNWTTIETKWMPQREAANKALAAADAKGDFPAELAAYQSYLNATQSWMTDLGNVKDWNDPSKTDVQNSVTAGDVNTLITVGGDEVTMLQTLVAATSDSDLAQYVDQVPQTEKPFNDALVTVVNDIMGSSGDKTTPAPIFIPNPCASPAASGSPGASGSPAPSGSAGAPPAVCASAAPSDSTAPSLSATPS
jgi:hypothetical protein